MKIFETLNISEAFVNPVLTIGNYDGLHLGHRQIIQKVKEKAHSISGTSMLMTFHPHPLSVVKPEKNIGLITPIHVKKRLIEECGIDVLVVVPFTEEFRQISAEVFVEDILLTRLAIKALIVGYDFRFGQNGKGDTHLLRRLSIEKGFSFEVVEAITIKGEKIGSNRVRRKILEGEMEKVKILLQRPHFIEGRVIRGDGRGREIGFPTINLESEFELLPKRGVYVTEVEVEGRRLPSVTNIGYNPTFEGKALSVETYILDLSADLYGRQITLYFHERIRDEMKFDSVGALKERIAADVGIARQYFKVGMT